MCAPLVALRRALLAAAVVAVAACQVSYPVAPSPTAASIELHVSSPGWPLRASTNLGAGAYIVDTDGVYHDVTRQATWTSSNPEVARYNAGVVPPLQVRGGGTADVTVSYEGMAASVRLVAYGCCESTAHPWIHVITLDAPIGGSRTATALLHESSVSSRNVTDLATWTSSNPLIASVDRGTLHAHLPGRVEITVSYGGATTTFYWSVSPRR
jgi:hypothetical protein